MLYKVYKNGQIVEGLLIDCNPEKSVENMIKFMTVNYLFQEVLVVSEVK